MNISGFKFSLVTVILVLTSCGIHHSMPNHLPEKLASINETRLPGKFSFAKRPFILIITEDLTTQPVGGYFSNSVMGSNYVISKPGYVLFEKIADSFKRHGAVVKRVYDNRIPEGAERLPGTTVIFISVKHVEFHKWKTPVMIIPSSGTMKYYHGAEDGDKPPLRLRTLVQPGKTHLLGRCIIDCTIQSNNKPPKKYGDLQFSVRTVDRDVFEFLAEQCVFHLYGELK